MDIDAIKEHFDKEFPREGCGVISVIKGKKKWIPVKNVSTDPDNFILDSDEYIRLLTTTDIIGIVHNHIGDNSEPSQADIDYCNALGIPYYIFSYPDMHLTVVQPETNVVDLYGREYKFGVRDCFEAVRDYLFKQGLEIPHRAAFEDSWYTKGLDYFTTEMVKKWKGEPVSLDELKENDVLLFKVNEEVNDHCGVYLGNDIFYHHAFNRLSCRENLYPFWYPHLVGAYRYVA
tara:strand:- start:7037 stop:7732 length:696 start_codon:yes stop_codon:yes gene_type:complete